ncbi:S4 domain-containing protein [Priestia megaterium]|uniref:S4 domain-containing protein n=1 Tax=Priestia megaterium TaxID=1404 RepID=UPI002E1B7061|nr:S4 domain-containing protein [Priestia megaterium]MED4116283.1 S4 domain-containing protein [Priestia megaterium]
MVKLELQSSKSEVRRMIRNAGVRIDGEKVEEVNLQVQVENGLVVQVSKRKFAKIKIT